MKLFTPEGDELMDVKQLRRVGNDLVIDGAIMGAMPTCAVLRPDEARAALKLLSLSLLLFLATFLFRRPGPKPAKPQNPLAGLLDGY
ncbi:MAG TPA: hypothetical protein VJM11_06190 [Nevskiaceae bacterium]|nr:hypothetical protein [Nevskiaceae bacterium]